MVNVVSLSDPQLTRLIQDGSVGVIPTDTIYGIACRADDVRAVTRLYALKHRENKPGTVIAANVEQLVGLGIARQQIDLAKKVWPAPVSVLMPATEHLAYLTQSKPELACRVIAGPRALIELIQQTGPLLTSSANAPGELPASTIAEAYGYFGAEVDFYADGGDLSGNLPSTLVRLGNNGIEVLRQGAGTIG